MGKVVAYELAQKWAGRLLEAQMGHYCLAEKYGRWAMLIGGTLIVLTVAITAVTFFTPSPEYEAAIQWGFRGVGIIVTILSAVQTFYKPNERAEVHRTQAARYGSLKRRVELTISCSEDERGLCAELIEVLKEWEGIALDSPLTKFHVLKEIHRKKEELANHLEN